jgi:hypothetical protein
MYQRDHGIFSGESEKRMKGGSDGEILQQDHAHFAEKSGRCPLFGVAEPFRSRGSSQKALPLPRAHLRNLSFVRSREIHQMSVSSLDIDFSLPRAHTLQGVIQRSLNLLSGRGFPPSWHNQRRGACHPQIRNEPFKMRQAELFVCTGCGRHVSFRDGNILGNRDISSLVCEQHVRPVTHSWDLGTPMFAM